MPPLHLVPPSLDVADELLRFETANRGFFETHINARPAGYYSAEGVRAAIALAAREAAEDKGYQFLVRTEAGELVGRVNLIGVKRAHFHSADLGYRMGEAACGKGYASEAVRQVLAKAFGELGLMRVEANARVGNGGSVRVLERNGFRQFGRSTKSFELGGVWHDRLHFERHLAAPPGHVGRVDLVSAPPGLRFRPVEEADLARVCAFPQSAQELFQMAPRAVWPWSPQQLAEAVATRADSTVAELDGEPVAFANFYRFEEGGRCAIGNVVVAPAARRLGVAGRLVEHMVDLARTRYGAAEVTLACFSDNAPALLLYTRLGFVPFAVEERRGPQGQRVALVQMRHAAAQTVG